MIIDSLTERERAALTRLEEAADSGHPFAARLAATKRRELLEPRLPDLTDPPDHKVLAALARTVQ